jgi:hypothetical protein
MRNEEVFHTLKEKRNIPDTIHSRKANWIGRTLQRICLLKHVIEQKIEGIGRRGRRRYTRLLDGLKEKRGYQKYTEEALYHALYKVTAEKAMDLLQDRLHNE